MYINPVNNLNRTNFTSLSRQNAAAQNKALQNGSMTVAPEILSSGAANAAKSVAFTGLFFNRTFEYAGRELPTDMEKEINWNAKQISGLTKKISNMSEDELQEKFRFINDEEIAKTAKSFFADTTAILENKGKITKEYLKTAAVVVREYEKVCEKTYRAGQEYIALAKKTIKFLLDNPNAKANENAEFLKEAKVLLKHAMDQEGGREIVKENIVDKVGY